MSEGVAPGPRARENAPVSDHRSAVTVPALDTERLTLRGHCPEDFSECLAMWADPQVTRYIGGRPQSREEVWTKLLRYVGHWAVQGFGFWVVRERDSGRLVGEVGVGDFKRDLEPPLADPEVGWVLARWAHGQGFATEAVRAVLEFSAAALGPRRLVCLIDPENLASIRVASKCGFVACGQTDYKGKLTGIFERRG
jgi:RimJ/RimL family protein N-acetyltransferase